MRKVHACLLLLAILLMPMMGIGENADIAEGVAMWINGEAVYQSQIDSVTASVTESMGRLGLDTSDEEIVSAISKVAQRQVIEDRLLSQDMTSQGMYDLTQEEEIEPVQFADTDSLPEDFKENFSPDTQMLNSLIDSVHKEAQKDPEGYGISGSLEPDEEDDAPLDDSGAPKKRRKKSRWLPIALCCLLLIAGIGAAVYFFIIAPSNLHINEITLVDTGTDYLTVQVESGEESGAFDVTCSDAYGNQSRKAYTAGEDMTFDSLMPGTQYTIEAVPLEGKKMTGSYSAIASTFAETKILSFTATPISITQAELNFIMGLISTAGPFRTRPQASKPRPLPSLDIRSSSAICCPTRSTPLRCLLPIIRF